MGRLTDREEIRRLLNADRIWGVFALGDLEPAHFAKSEWFGPEVTLVYSDYGTCILFAMGDGGIAESMAHVKWPVHLQLRPGALREAERIAEVTSRKQMWRMGWTGDRSGWVDIRGARRLTLSDVPALRRLFTDGAAHGESPDFFFPSMVEQGVFHGIFEGDELVASAGTHLFIPSEGVAAIGHVYTRRDRRGRGLSKAVTCATLGALAHLETVGLSVRVENAAAIRVYEALGFRKHCEFFEALATGPCR